MSQSPSFGKTSPAMRTSLLITLLLLSLTNGAHVCVLRDAPDLPPQSLPDHRINDDYCDCDDASDENRTSACTNGFFTCENAQYRPVQIYSSWVHDGSCDCCDGSDEPPGACQDTCATLRAEHLKEATRKADIVRRGIATRKSYKRDIERDMKNEQFELRKLEKQLASIERQLKSHEKRADILRKRRDWEDGIKQTTSDESPPSYEAPPAEPDYESGQHNDYEDDEFRDDDGDYDYSAGHEDDGEDDEVWDGGEDVDEHPFINADEDAEEAIENAEEAIENAEEAIENAGEAVEDAREATENAEEAIEVAREATENAEEAIEDAEEAFEDVPEANAGDEPSMDPGIAEDASETVPSTENEPAAISTTTQDVEPEAAPEPSDAVDVESLCAELESSSPNWFVRRVVYFRTLLLSKMKRFLPNKLVSSIGAQSSNLSDCISKAESAKWDLESKKREIQNKIDELKKKDSIDFGADNALRKLHGSCTKGKVTQYEFEMCMFDIVRQYENGVSIAQLGKFDGWEGEGKDRVMKYSEGDRCWNGPPRSIKVELLCSDKEEVVSVDEPSRCTYRMIFKTPAVCEEYMVDEIMADFSNSGSEEKQEL